MPSGNIRLQKWRYNHPRTFKLFLSNYLSEDDFKYNGLFLTKGTDRPLVYSNLELSGRKRSQHIEKMLYVYREHNNCSYKTIDAKFRQEQINYINNLSPKSELQEEIHIVMCCYKRFGNLKTQIKALNSNEDSYKINLHLVNNNLHEKDAIEDIVSHCRSHYKNIEIYLSHYDNSYYGFQRFFYIRDVLLKNFIVDYVIIIDDDQLFDAKSIYDIYSLKEPQTYKGWYVKLWDWDSNIDYWHGSSINKIELLDNVKENIIDVSYVGTGGSVVDANIFNPNSKLWDAIVSDDFSAYNIEDLWLSHVASYEYNWKLQRTFIPPIKEFISDNDLEHSLWTSLKKQKQKFLQRLLSIRTKSK